MRVYHTIRGWTQADGSIMVENWTNDNEDRGWPSGDAYWTTTYKNQQYFDKCVGKSRIGVSGCQVDVYLDGKRLDR